MSFELKRAEGPDWRCEGAVMRAKAGMISAAVVRVPSFAILTVQTQPVGAQGGWRRLSPHDDVSATIDGAMLTIEYGRPSMRGRKIFGWLVPFDAVWCPGADEATTLESTHV